MPTARNNWIAQQTGYTGAWGGGAFQRWKAKQGGKIAATDWTAASMRWQSMQPKRTLPKKAVAAPTRIIALTARELLKKRNDAWKNPSSAMSARVAAYKAANPRSRHYSKAGLMQKIKAYDASGTVANINNNLTAATDAYQANPNRATAQALKTWVSVRQARQGSLTGTMTANKRADKAALFASSATENAARKNLGDAFSKGLVGRDKGGFLQATIDMLTTPAIAAPLAMITAGASLAASAPTAASAGGGLLSIPATDLTSLATGGAVTQAGGYAGSALAPTVTGMTSAGLGSAGTALAAGATGAASAGGGLLSTVSNLLPSNLTGVDIAKGAAGAASSLINANTASKNNQAALQNTQAQINANAAQQQTTINANATGNIGNTTAGLNGGTNAMPTLSGSNPYLALLK